MGLSVQSETIENRVEGGGDDFEFAPGSYRGVIEEVETRDTPGYVGRGAGPSRSEWEQAVKTKNNGWQSPDVEILSVRIGQIETMDPDLELEIGDRKFFAPSNPNSDGYTIRDGNLSIAEANFNPEDDDADYWRLQRAADATNAFAGIVRLAAALGQTVEKGDEVELREGFVQDLQHGKFKGEEIGFEVDHFGTYESGGEEVTDQRIVQFFPV